MSDVPTFTPTFGSVQSRIWRKRDSLIDFDNQQQQTTFANLSLDLPDRRTVLIFGMTRTSAGQQGHKFPLYHQRKRRRPERSSSSPGAAIVIWQWAFRCAVVLLVVPLGGIIRHEKAFLHQNDFLSQTNSLKPHLKNQGRLMNSTILSATTRQGDELFLPYGKKQIKKRYNATRLTSDFVSKVVPPPFHIFKPPPSFFEKDVQIAREMEQLAVTASLPTNKGNSPRIRHQRDANYDVEGILHVVNTRFMTYQPNLVDLGKARLNVFNTTCLPSMVHQTTQNFLWLIYTDPDLDTGLLQSIKDVLAPYPNFYLIRSLLPKQRGLQGRDVLKHVPQGNIVTGNVTKLWANLANDQKLFRVYLETHLDADDALNLRFLEYVQGRAHSLFIEENNHPNRPGKQSGNLWWMFWCINRAVEWHWVDQDDDSSPDSLKTYGAIFFSRNYSEIPFCPGLGMTVGVCARGTPGSTFRRTVLKAPHHLVVETLESEKISCGDNYDGLRCVEFISKLGYSALRSRMPVSSTADAIGSSFKYLKQARDEAIERWTGFAIPQFDLLPSNAKATVEYLRSGLPSIQKDILHSAADWKE